MDLKQYCELLNASSTPRSIEKSNSGKKTDKKNSRKPISSAQIQKIIPTIETIPVEKEIPLANLTNLESMQTEPIIENKKEISMQKLLNLLNDDAFADKLRKIIDQEAEE
jgi:hypothetical protein